MSLTDRAFITAYQAPVTATTVSSGAAPPARSSAEEEPRPPHFAVASSAEKRPLSSLLGEQGKAAVAGRRTLAAKPTPIAVPAPQGFELAGFAWPKIAVSIADHHRDTLNSLMADLTRPLTLVGAHAGAGATSISLALALIASQSNREVLLIDAAPQSRLAELLGVATLPELATANANDDLLKGRSLRGRRDGVTLAIAGASFTSEHAIRIAQPASKQLVIIDAGPARTAEVATRRWSPWSASADFLLVDGQPTNERRRDAILTLRGAGVTPQGIIENVPRGAEG